MNVLEFVESVGANDPAPVILVGPGKAYRARQDTFEPFLAGRAVDRIVETYVDDASRDMCYSVFYADETPADAVVAEAETYPFLAERRVVVVRNADRYNTDAAAGPILRYLEQPAETTILVLVADKTDKRKKFYKACKAVAEIVECPQLNEGEVKRWVKDQLANLGKRANDAAIRALVDRTGTVLSDVDNALELVTGYVGEDVEVVTEADVNAACADVAEEEVWALTDAIAASKVGAALTALRALMDLGRSPDDIMGTINWMLTNAYHVARQGVANAPLAPFVAQKVEPLAKKLGSAKIADAFKLHTKTHFHIRSTGTDAPLALELLVVKLAAPRARAR